MLPFRQWTTKLKRPLRLLYWNADGVERDKLLLGVILEREDIDIALLGETKLKPNGTLKVRKYSTYHSPGPNTPHVDTAMLIKSSIHHCPIQTPQFHNLQLIAVKIITESETLAIGSLYHSPSFPLRTDDLDALYSLKINFIYASDMNAKHTNWNSRLISTKGRTLAEHAESNDYDIIAPKNIPTSQGTQTTTPMSWI